MWGGLFCFIFQEKNLHIKNFWGRILTGGIWGVFLYVYVLFSLLIKEPFPERNCLNQKPVPAELLHGQTGQP